MCLRMRSASWMRMAVLPLPFSPKTIEEDGLARSPTIFSKSGWAVWRSSRRAKTGSCRASSAWNGFSEMPQCSRKLAMFMPFVPSDGSAVDRILAESA